MIEKKIVTKLNIHVSFHSDSFAALVSILFLDSLVVTPNVSYPKCKLSKTFLCMSYL